MIVVSDSSPLITLAKVDLLRLVPGLFGRVAIPSDVYEEIVEKGAGLTGSSEIRAADWIDVQPPSRRDQVDSVRAMGLGAGEAGAIVLAEELQSRRDPHR